MIKKFEVYNFKGFKNNFIFDFSKTRDYCFNTNLIKNKIVNKAIIYGKNGSGKSNLGLALYDLTIHLTDKQRIRNYKNNYRNLDNKENYATFIYTFQFEDDEITYSYHKNDSENLSYENLKLNGDVLLEYDYINKTYKNDIEGLNNLNIDLPDNKLSILKYIYKNTPTDESSPINKVVRFAEGMLWFRCLIEGNDYIGLNPSFDDLNDSIIKNDKLKDFELFLNKNGLKYNLFKKEVNGNNYIYVKYKNGEASLSSIISSGTKALWLYYGWSLFFDRISFLYLDEFDAYYHYETAEVILKLLSSNHDFQTVVTSHNTYLMQNNLTRPDCCFIVYENEYIKPLSDCTEKEIREAHNLEKMYRNGAFID